MPSKQLTVQSNLIKKKRGRPKGSKNKRTVLSAYREGSIPVSEIKEIVQAENLRYKLRSRIEKDGLDMPQKYHFIYDLKRGDIYPEIIARFTVETEAKLCTEFLNGLRKISKRQYNKKRICIL